MNVEYDDVAPLCLHRSVGLEFAGDGRCGDDFANFFTCSMHSKSIKSDTADSCQVGESAKTCEGKSTISLYCSNVFRHL